LKKQELWVGDECLLLLRSAAFCFILLRFASKKQGLR
jgi:hypothetical protein